MLSQVLQLKRKKNKFKVQVVINTAPEWVNAVKAAGGVGGGGAIVAGAPSVSGAI